MRQAAGELLKDDKTLEWIKTATGAQMSEFKTGGAGLPGDERGVSFDCVAGAGGRGRSGDFRAEVLAAAAADLAGAAGGDFRAGGGGGFGAPPNPNAAGGAGGASGMPAVGGPRSRRGRRTDCRICDGGGGADEQCGGGILGAA